MGFFKYIIKILKGLTCKSKCCSGSSCECGINDKIDTESESTTNHFGNAFVLEDDF